METTSGNDEAAKSLGVFLAAVRFLTVLPIFWKSEQDGDNLKKCLVWFSLVGLIIGLFICCLAYTVSWWLPDSLVSFVVVFLLSAVSGFLHVDGVADTADGFLSAKPKENILEIMKDSRIGPMGVTALLFLFIGKLVALSTLAPDQVLLAAILLPVAGRSAIVMQIALLSYARGNPGLGALFDLSNQKKANVVSLLVFIVVSLWTFPAQSVLLIVVFAMVTVLFKVWCQRKIGGYTGDTLGASCEIMELMMAITLCNTIV